MTARLTLLAITAFWVTMNVLLWRAEYGSRGGDSPVPVELVWRKILTAPEASSLSIYQNGQRMGFCEFSTSVGQQMATLDENKLPPEGFAARAGNQIHLVGNVAFGDFTNRVKFDGRLRFSAARQWRELSLKISTRPAVAEIHSFATNRTVHLKVTAGEGVALERDLALADLENPRTLLAAFGGGFGDVLTGALDLPALVAPGSAAQTIQWEARLTRIKIGTETVPVFQVETRVLDRPVVMDVSTMGEILRVELPGGIVAQIDEWGRQ